MYRLKNFPNLIWHVFRPCKKKPHLVDSNSKIKWRTSNQNGFWSTWPNQILGEISCSRYFYPCNFWRPGLLYNPLINYAPASRYSQYRIKKLCTLSLNYVHLAFRNLFLLLWVMLYDENIQEEITYRFARNSLPFYLSKYVQY